jgi:hypothetical protein
MKITDLEIRIKAGEYCIKKGSNNIISYNSFIEGAEWLREKIKADRLKYFDSFVKFLESDDCYIVNSKGEKIEDAFIHGENFEKYFN